MKQTHFFRSDRPMPVIPEGGDPKAYTTDYKAMGIHGKNAFYILDLPRATPAPTRFKKKPGRPRKSIEKTLAALSEPNHFNVDIMSREESDRTLAILGPSS